MSARQPGPEQEPSLSSESYLIVEGLVNQRLIDAAEANAESSRHLYVMHDRQPGTPHPLAVFCVANSVEPLGRQKTEQLVFSVPVASPDVEAPISLLGSEEHYFYLTYMALGGTKTLPLDPVTYIRRFEGNSRPPVHDLTHKLLTYVPFPMRERPLDEA